ncbi:beta-lactamase-like protein [Rhizophagus clarus]|uniref:Beta-lactamase-like protein n=1 Tax=Rhizophagus clarus TaxID=94130 RepID=A0A8H3M4W7_9GLOM|nr:beta-lactamase-like protein [Rhizophagus clarus]
MILSHDNIRQLPLKVVEVQEDLRYGAYGFIWTTDDEDISAFLWRSVRYGEHLLMHIVQITIVSSSSAVQDIHPLPFDEPVFNYADVIVYSDLRDIDGARFENILMKIGTCYVVLQYITEESLKYFNICGEWMCTERRQKMYLPDNPMPHQDMIERSLLYYASRADSSLQEKHKMSNNSDNSIIFTESEHDCEEEMSASESLTYISPIDIRLTRFGTVMTENLASNIELVNLGKDF